MHKVFTACREGNTQREIFLSVLRPFRAVGKGFLTVNFGGEIKLPSEKVLELKKKAVAELTDSLTNSAAGVIVDYKGITVADDTKLRKELREAGVKYTVVKNTL